MIALCDCGAEGAPHAMERLRLAVSDETVETDKGAVSVTISLGGAVSDTSDADLDELIRAADEALYAAKGAGRNCPRAARRERRRRLMERTAS